MAFLKHFSSIALVSILPACSKVDTKDARRSPNDTDPVLTGATPAQTGDGLAQNPQENPAGAIGANPGESADGKGPGAPPTQSGSSGNMEKSGQSPGQTPATTGGAQQFNVTGMSESLIRKAFDTLVPASDCAKSLAIPESAVQSFTMNGLFSLGPKQGALLTAWGNKEKIAVDIKASQGTFEGFCGYIGGNQNSFTLNVNAEVSKVRIYTTGNGASIEVNVPKGGTVKAFEFGFGVLPGSIKITGEGTYDCEKGIKWTGNLFSTLTCRGKTIN